MYYIGIDSGGTKTAIGLVLRKKILAKTEFPTKAENGYNYFLGKLIQNIQKLLISEKINIKMISGIGIVVPGILDTENGIILDSPNLKDWKSKNIINDLQQALNKKVCLENDANAYIAGEIYNMKEDISNSVGITLGTGLGGAVYINGKLLTGSNNAAGEIGHMIVLPDGPKCGCGKNGCIEAIASGTGVVNLISFFKNDESAQKSKLFDIAAPTSKDVFQLENKDIYAEFIINKMLYYLSIAVSNIINLLDPEIFIIGGGLSSALTEKHMEFLKREIKDKLFEKTAEKLNLRKSVLGNDAPILGVVSKFFEN